MDDLRKIETIQRAEEGVYNADLLGRCDSAVESKMTECGNSLHLEHTNVCEVFECESVQTGGIVDCMCTEKWWLWSRSPGRSY